MLQSLREASRGKTGNASYRLGKTAWTSLFKEVRVFKETKNVLDYQGRAGSTSIVQWTLRPVIFGVENCLLKRA